MKLPWCLYRTWTNQRQQYSEMPRRHRSVFVPQHSFRTCLWGSVTPLHVCTTSARMYPWREYICRWHVNAEREELLGHDCRNHYNCWWAIMEVPWWDVGSLEIQLLPEESIHWQNSRHGKQSTTHTFLLTCRYLSMVSWLSPEVTIGGRHYIVCGMLSSSSDIEGCQAVVSGVIWIRLL